MLFGETDAMGCMRNLLETRDADGLTAVERLPAVVPLQEIAAVEKFLLAHNVPPTAELATRTVRQTVETLTRQFLAVQMWDLCRASAGTEVQAAVNVHGVASAASASAEMFEGCTVEVAKAVQETLKILPEEQPPQLEPEPEAGQDPKVAATVPPEGGHMWRVIELPCSQIISECQLF
eukprot:COSAG01_NODE_3046_length_6672_cov_4.249962_3_plen_178_part_00